MKRLGWGIAFAAIVPAWLSLFSAGCSDRECVPECPEVVHIDFPEGGLAPGAWAFDISAGLQQGTCSLSVPSQFGAFPSCTGLQAQFRYITEEGVGSVHPVGIELQGALSTVFIRVKHQGVTVLEREFGVLVPAIPDLEIGGCDSGKECYKPTIHIWDDDIPF